MVGIGFAREADAQAESTPDKNPALNIAGGDKRRNGYVLTPEGIHVGLTRENTKGDFRFVKLERQESLPDWKAVPACIAIAGATPPACGTMLVDTGVGAHVHDGAAVAGSGRRRCPTARQVSILLGNADAKHAALRLHLRRPLRSAARRRRFISLVSDRRVFVNTSFHLPERLRLIYVLDGADDGFRPHSAGRPSGACEPAFVVETATLSANRLKTDCADRGAAAWFREPREKRACWGGIRCPRLQGPSLPPAPLRSRPCPRRREGSGRGHHDSRFGTGPDLPVLRPHDERLQGRGGQAGRHAVIESDGRVSSPKQTADVEAAITKGVQGIVIGPNEVDAMAPALQQAVEAGIPVVTVDRRVAAGRGHPRPYRRRQRQGRRGAGRTRHEAVPDGADDH